MARNLIITGGIFHPFEETSEALSKALEPLGIASTITLDVEAGLSDLAKGQYELLTVNALRWQMLNHEKYKPYLDEWQFTLSKEGRRAISEHVSAGGGMLALHTSSICFDTWTGWRDVLGGVWKWDVSFHPPLGRVSAHFLDADHPMTDRLDDFQLEDEVYHHLDMKRDVTPLLTGQTEDGEPHTLAWCHQYGEGRVVYDALGHDAMSIDHPMHQRFLKRAAAWALQQTDDEVRQIS